MSKARGFTLLELLVILVILASIVTIALPGFLSSKVDANEIAAVATLRQIVQWSHHQSVTMRRPSWPQ